MSNSQFANNRREALVITVVAFITICLYWQTLSFGFVDYDDYTYIIANTRLHSGITLNNILWALTSSYACNWHPLTWMSHMLDIQLFDLHPAGHHLTSVILHCINTLLLLKIFHKMTGNFWRSTAVAILFAVHPLHVESVAYIAERKDVLSTLFWLLTMCSYVSYVKKPGLFRYILTLFLYALGLSAKPMLVTLPFVLLLLDYWPLKRIDTKKSLSVDFEKRASLQYRALLIEKIPLFVLSIVSCVITYRVQASGGAVNSLEPGSLLDNTSSALIAYISYIFKTVWPVKLAAFYPFQAGIPWWSVAGAGLLLVIFTIAAIRMRGEYPYVLFGWLWYMGTLVPVSGVVRVGAQAMADRYTYVPLIGIFIILVWGLGSLSEYYRSLKIVITVATPIVFLLLVMTSWQQATYWKNSITLFSHAIEVTKGNWFAHHNLGVAFVNQGRYEDALLQFHKAVNLRPTFSKAYYQMGNTYIMIGDVSHAIESFRQTIALDPYNLAAHRDLILAYNRLGDRENASAQNAVLKKVAPELAKELELTVQPH